MRHFLWGTDVFFYPYMMCSKSDSLLHSDKYVFFAEFVAFLKRLLACKKKSSFIFSLYFPHNKASSYDFFDWSSALLKSLKLLNFTRNSATFSHVRTVTNIGCGKYSISIQYFVLFCCFFLSHWAKHWFFFVQFLSVSMNKYVYLLFHHPIIPLNCYHLWIF